MRAKLHLVFAISMFFISFCSLGQQGYWRSISKESSFKSPSLSNMQKATGVYTLDYQAFSKILSSFKGNDKAAHLIYFPDYNGNTVPFNIIETPLLHPDLTKKYPNIRSFSGMSLDGNYKIKFSSSHKGLEAMVINITDHKATYMEQLSNKTDTYVVYQREGATEKDDFVCATEKIGALVAKTIDPLVTDQVLRRFRIAVSASGEYTDFHGGTVADALAAINATLTRVNEVFETDLGVTLELVANNDQVIFTDASTDPYDDNLNSEVQNTLTTVIGEENYDVGHLFHKVGEGQDNGNAGFIGSVCSDNRKGSAFSSAFNPQGDVFDLDFVSHELGHQFGANHTWSFESEGTGVQAEPASGTTIMGYAGIVLGNNVAENGDDYFHYNSIDQIRNYLETVTCGEDIVLTNTPPVLTPVPDYVIPKGTAFVLEGVATDADVSDVLTYAWEQLDNGVVTTSSFGPDNPSGANFRSLPPTTDPERYFPRLSRVVSGDLTQTNPLANDAWETISNIERDLNFAVTVRDNAMGGGQVVSDLLTVITKNSAGPFSVISQADGEVYDAGTVQEVTWDVANTNGTPINAQTVDIFLSVDGGVSFPVTLATNVLNDGSADVLLPGTATNAARIMVKASDNIFFAINSADFTIQESEVVLEFQELAFEVCQPDDVVIPFSYRAFSGFNETSTFSANVLPGLVVGFNPTQASADDTSVELTLSNTNGVAPGVYPISVTATSASVTKTVELSLTIGDGTFQNITLLSPADASTNVSVNPILEWELNPEYSSYDFEIATDAGFTNIVETSTTSLNFYQPSELLPETEYFWRVRPNGHCGTGNFGTPFGFTTIQLDCKSKESTDVPIEISAIGTSVQTSSLQFFDDLPINEVKVTLELTHTYVEDLTISLISPSGTKVALISNNCGDQNDINATFENGATEITCSGNPAISGTVEPLGSLDSFKGESSFGEWILEIQDNATGDGGSLVAFSLEICAEGAFRPDEDEDGVFDDGDDLCLGTPKGIAVDTSGCPINEFPVDNFTIEIESETCRTNNDGTVTISAVDNTINYSAVLDGGGSTLNSDFTDEHTFQNLSAGTYSLCITGTDGLDTYRETCFSIEIVQPELLAVVASLTENSLDLTLSGGSLYNVELNGQVTQTEHSKISLDLRDGVNQLKVFTNLPCQGTYEEVFFVSSNAILYPNPVANEAKVFLNGYSGPVTIHIFDGSGRLVSVQRQTLDGGELIMDFSQFQTGAYYLNLHGSGINEEFKLIKE